MTFISDITLIPNTGRIFVVWQEPRGGKRQDTGERFVVGEILYNNEFEQINYFSNQDIERAKKLGFRQLDALSGKEGQKLTSNEISKALEKRVLSKDREDFDSYLKSYMISPEIKNQMDTLTLLTNTGRGKNFGDGYSFFPDIQNVHVPFQITFEIAGHRHTDGMKYFADKAALRGKRIILEVQDSNEHDPYALQISIDGIVIGYTPKGLSKGLYRFVTENNIDAFIARVNGTMERPNLIVLAKVK